MKQPIPLQESQNQAEVHPILTQSYALTRFLMSHQSFMHLLADLGELYAVYVVNRQVTSLSGSLFIIQNQFWILKL